MLRIFGLLLMLPFIAAAIVLRVALFVPFAVLFLLPVLIMRPRLILKAPHMFGYMFLARRGGRGYCGPGRGRRGRWRGTRLETVADPIKL